MSEWIGETSSTVSADSCLLVAYRSDLFAAARVPSDSGAVSLSDASGEDDLVIDAVLTEVRRRVQAGDEQLEDYCVSLLEMQGEANSNSNSDAASPAAAASDAQPTPVAAPTPSSPASACGGDCLVVRLWHAAVFLGARETALGNPGAKCRDWHFSPSDGAFRHQLALEDTDAIMEAQEHGSG